VREDILSYFMNAPTDAINVAYKELKEDDITLDEIRLMRIKFISDYGN
jgi:ATP-dependent DNA helicase RecQ